MYVKLFGSILDSTVWQEPATTRVVWITMLAMADEEGHIRASLPGLAKRAGVTLEECETALSAFIRPDPYSSTKEHEGRRIEAADGGWFLLNYAKYRAIKSKEDRRGYERDRKREQRANQKASHSVPDKPGQSRGVPDGPALSVQEEAEAEAEAEAKGGGGGGAGAPPAGGEKKQSPVKAVIAKIDPLWSAKYGRPFVASREDRRSLGVTLQGFLDLGAKGEAEIAKLPIWFGRFLADDREAYVKQAHSLRQFLNDLNAHSLSPAERLHANGQRTPDEWRAEDEAQRRRVDRGALVNELPNLPKGEPRPKETLPRLHGSPAVASSGVGSQQESAAAGGER